MQIKNFSKLGFYEKRLLILLGLSAIPNPFGVLQSLVSLYTPPFECSLQGNYQVNQTKWNDTAANISNSDDQSNSCNYRNITGNIANLNESRMLPCTKFIFDGPEISAVTEFELVCLRSWIQPYLVSIYFFGKMAGSLVGGLMSDRYGRKPVFLVFTFLQFIVSIATSFVGDITSYAVMLFVSGGVSVVNFMAGIVLGVEVVPAQNRSVVYFIMDVGYSIGYMIVPLLAYLFRDWRWFLRITGLIGIFYIPYFWFIDESPFWLASVGKEKEANKIRKKIRKTNEQPKEEENPLQTNKSEIDFQGCLTSFGTLLREPILILRLLTLALAWVVVYMTYFTISLNTNSLSGNRFLNTFYAGLTELVGVTLYYVAVESVGRRNTYSGVMSMTAVSIAVTPWLGLWSGTAVTITTMFSKLTLSLTFGVIYTYSGELFPTSTRHSWMAILSTIGGVGSIISPFVIQVGTSDNVFTPSYITAALIALSSATVMLLPETKNKPLPQTVQQATAMRRKFTCSCTTKPCNSEATEIPKLQQTVSV